MSSWWTKLMHAIARWPREHDPKTCELCRLEREWRR